MIKCFFLYLGIPAMESVLLGVFEVLLVKGLYTWSSSSV